jgi:hypothetical protein
VRPSGRLRAAFRVFNRMSKGCAPFFAEASPAAPTSGVGLRALLAVTVFATFVLVLGAGPAFAAPYKIVGSFANGGFGPGGSGSEDGQLSNPGQAAVNDVTGNLYVADTGNNRVEVFKPNPSGGEYLSQTPISEPNGLAIDQTTGDVYVSTPTGIAKLDEGLSPVSSWSEPGVSGSLAVDPTSGDLLVAETADNQISRFESDGIPDGSFTAERPIALAALASGEVLVVTSTGDVTLECGASSTVRRFSAAGSEEGVLGVGLEAPGAVAVDPDEGAILVAARVNQYNCAPFAGPEIASFAADGTPTGQVSFDANAQYAAVPGLAAAGGNSQLAYAVTKSPANDGFGNTQIVALREPRPAAPEVATGGTPYVSATSVRFVGTIDPNLLPTTYWVEYGTSSSYGSRFPVAHDAQTGDGEDPKSVTVQVEGLSSETQYHYRFVAKNSLGEAFGADRTVATGSLFPPAPSGRAYEMVSPVEKDGFPVMTDNGANVPLFQAAADGSSIIYPGRGAFDSSDPAAFLNTDYLAERGSSGWASQSIDAPFAPFAGIDSGSVVQTSPDGSHALIQSSAVLAPGATETNSQRMNLYMRDNRTDAYRFIATIPYGKATTPSLGGTDDFSTVEFTADAALTPDAPVGAWNIYTWSAGQGIRLVDYLPDGSPAPEGGAPNRANGAELLVGLYRPHLLSTDGTRAYFEEVRSGGFNGGLYLRINPSQPQSPLAPVSGTGDLSAATGTGKTTAGSNIIQSVTTSSGAFAVGQEIGGEGSLLNGVEVTAIPGPGELEVSVPAVLSSNGVVLTAGSDQITAFTPIAGSVGVGTEVVGPGIARGTTVIQVGAGTLTLSRPTTVSATAATITGVGACTDPSKACTVAVSSSHLAAEYGEVKSATFHGASADGDIVYFTSAAGLTESAKAHPGTDLYRYEVGSGSLTDLTGAGPGAATVGEVLGVGADGTYVYFIAGAVLTATPNSSGDSAIPGGQNIYVWHQGEGVAFVATTGNVATIGQMQTWSLSPDGRYLAFQTAASGLAGYDTAVSPGHVCTFTIPGNPVPTNCQEIYLYNARSAQLNCVSCPSGDAAPVGSAQIGGTWVTGEAARGYWKRFVLNNGTVFFDSPERLVSGDSNGNFDVYEWRNGRLGLISPGDADDVAHFADAGADGSSVFFTTQQQVLRRDVDSLADVYVARQGGGFPESPTAAPPCQGEACQGQSVPPGGGAAPGTASLQGPPNQRPHRPKRHHAKKHHAKKKSKYAGKSHKKSHGRHKRSVRHNRGGGK